LVEEREEKEQKILLVETTRGIDEKKTADDVLEILEKKRKKA